MCVDFVAEKFQLILVIVPYTKAINTAARV